MPVRALSSLDGNAALLDSGGTIVAVNHSWTEFGLRNGATPSTIGVGVSYLNECRKAATESDSAKQILDGLISVLDGTSTLYRCDYKCEAPGERRWYRLTITPWNAPGARVLVLHSDISRDKLSAEIQNRTLKSVRAIIWSAEVADFRTTFLAGQVEEILGFPARAWLDDPELWTKQIHPQDRDRILQHSFNAIQEGRDHEFDYRMVAADGRTIWLRQIVNLVHEDGRPTCLAGISFDISELKQAQERSQILSERILKAHDEERSRIARELHDDIGQRLAFLGMDLARSELTHRGSLDVLLGAVKGAKNQVSEISRDVSALSHALHSSALDARGLESAIDELCRDISARRNVTIDFRSQHVPKHIPDSTSLGVFRILQEAIQNAVKHSGGNAFEVTLSGSSHAIELSVSDNGRGFDRTRASKGKGLGLTSMEERAKLMGGELSIYARESQGTTIRARIPLKTRVSGSAKSKN